MSIKARIDQALHRLQGVPFVVRYWEGESVVYGAGEPVFTAHIKTADAARRMLGNLPVRVPEAYVEGDLEIAGDLQALVKLFCENGDPFSHPKLPQKLTVTVWSWLRRNSIAGARRNIMHHYDIGNEFFSLWLDKQMVYSGAYFEHIDDDINTAQQQKLQHICTKLRLDVGQRVLDIGCGWGALAIHAAREHGVRVTGITLSDEQRSLAQAKLRQMNLEERVEFRLMDYREIRDGEFDRIVSVGMMEHVGKSYLPIYMSTLARCVRRGGMGVLQTMGMTEKGEVTPWITKHVFPGMYLPTLGEIFDYMSDSGLHILDVENLRAHYVLTLDAWIERVEQKVDQIADMFDERFVRLWRMYLNLSSAAFKFGGLNLWQITFSRGLPDDAPLTRRYVYQFND